MKNSRSKQPGSKPREKSRDSFRRVLQGTPVFDPRFPDETSLKRVATEAQLEEFHQKLYELGQMGHDIGVFVDIFIAVRKSQKNDVVFSSFLNHNSPQIEEHTLRIYQDRVQNGLRLEDKTRVN